MEMVMFSFSTIGSLVFAAGATNSPDLASLISARDYFQVRSIELKADRMVELAGTGSKDGQAPLAQLLAIRWLGEHSREAGRGARIVLKQIAAEKKANDRLGFAKQYALQALARLDGKPLPLDTLPADSVRVEGLNWFPARSTIFGGIDFRPTRDSGHQDNQMLRSLTRMFPERGRREMYDFADKVGNIRVERVSFAVIPGAKEERTTQLFIRFTGRGDGLRVLDFLRKQGAPADVAERKGANGERIAIIDMKNNGPALAFIGDTDLVMCGYPAGARDLNQMDVLEEVLQIRAGKKASIARGPYSGTLKGSSAQAAGLLIGDLPDYWHQNTTSRGSPFKGFPKSFNLSMIRTARGTDFRFSGSAASAQEARAFVESVEKLKKEGIEGLKQLPPQLKVKPNTIDALQTAIKGIKMESQDALLTGRAAVSKEVLHAIADLMETAVKMIGEQMKGINKDGPVQGKFQDKVRNDKP